MSRKTLSIKKPIKDYDDNHTNEHMTGQFKNHIAQQRCGRLLGFSSKIGWKRLPVLRKIALPSSPQEEKSEYLEVRGVTNKQLLNPFTIPNIIQLAIDHHVDIRFWHYGVKIILERKYLTGPKNHKDQDFKLVKEFYKGEFGYYLKRHVQNTYFFDGKNFYNSGK